MAVLGLQPCASPFAVLIEKSLDSRLIDGKDFFDFQVPEIVVTEGLPTDLRFMMERLQFCLLEAVKGLGERQFFELFLSFISVGSWALGLMDGPTQFCLLVRVEEDREADENLQDHRPRERVVLNLFLLRTTLQIRLDTGLHHDVVQAVTG